MVDASIGAIAEESPTLEFESFYTATHERMVRSLALVVGSLPEAEDLVQEAMARAFERWPRVGRMEAPEGYVYRTAINFYRMGLRRLRNHRSRQPLLSPVPDGPDRIEQRLDLAHALTLLPVGQRAAVVLVEWWGMSTEQAANVLRVRPVTVRSRLHRARRALRELVGDLDE
jgi:RNA polymerase sigma-70 factor, ECF subfamily